MNFETIIGIEVHAELSTKSKIWCGCSRTYGAETNTQTCPICLGHPGVLPKLNEEAVNLAIKAAMALNCEIATDTKFDRKTISIRIRQKRTKSRNSTNRLALTVTSMSKSMRDETFPHRAVHLEEDAGR